MSLATQLLRAEPVGVKELKNNLSAILKKGKARIVTDRNKPQHVLVPYNDMVELVELLDELSDPRLLKQIAEGREGHRKGKSVPLERLAKDLGLKGS